MKVRLLTRVMLIAVSLAGRSAAHSEEVFIGNPGKSLNFFHFDLAIERGYSRNSA